MQQRLALHVVSDGDAQTLAESSCCMQGFELGSKRILKIPKRSSKKRGKEQTDEQVNRHTAPHPRPNLSEAQSHGSTEL